MARTSRVVTGVAAGVCAAALFVFLSCSKGGTGGVDVEDDVSPSSVNDLRTKSITSTSVTLEWTAPGDRDTVGTAKSYDMRYSKSEITWQNWDSATPLVGEPQPKSYGSTDTMRVTGLTEDSTYFFALKTLGHNGNWSWLSNCEMAICFDDFEVTIADPQLEGIIRATIGKPTGPIRRSDLLGVQFIDANNRGITTLAGLEYCVNLEAIFMWNNLLSDFTPLSGLVKLRSIQAGQNKVSDIRPLAGLVNLEQLFLNNNTITDISAMSNMAKLKDINLAVNQITTVAALADKPDMTMLMLGNNEIADVSALSGMTNLTNLDLSENQVTSIDALSGMTKLKWLGLYNNQITDVSPLTAVINLTYLNLQRNNISNIWALSGMTKLETLFVTENQISDINPLSTLTSLKQLYLTDNLFADISPLSALTALVDLQFQRCKVVDLAPLQGLINLQQLVLISNLVVEITPLVENVGINMGDKVYLFGNPLSQEAIDRDIPALRVRGVEVYF